jgi:predicted PurR-regulated permease PerM
MLGLDARAAKVTWTVGVVALAFYAVYMVRSTLLVFVLALFLAYVIAPLVTLIEHHKWARLPRPVSVLAAFLLVIGAIGIGATLIAPSVADEAQLLSEQLPQLVEKASLANIPLPSWLEAFRGKLNAFVQENLKTAMLAAMPFARSVGTEIILFAGNLVVFVLIPIVAFFFVKDGPQIRDAFLRWLNPVAPRGNLSRIVSDLDDALGRYVRALGLLSLATLIAYGIFFSATGVPYAIFLAAIAAFLEILPLLGPLTAALIALFVAGLSGYDHLLWIAGFILCYRIFQDYVLYPYLMGDRSRIPPVMIIFGLLAGEQLGGVAGVFLSVPVIVALVIVARHSRDNDTKSIRTSAPE